MYVDGALHHADAGRLHAHPEDVPGLQDRRAAKRNSALLYMCAVVARMIAE